MDSLKVLFISEAPFVPSSMGKVVYGMTTELARRGHEVAVISLSAAPSPTLMSFGTVFNPRKWAELNGSPIPDRYPDVDVVVYPWGKLYPLQQAVEKVMPRPDVVIVYTYPYIEQEINHEVYQNFTSKDIPAIVYALHEGPYMMNELSLTVLAYTAVSTPTKFVRDQYLGGLLSIAKAKGVEVDVTDIERRFSVVPHGVDVSLYSRDVVEELQRFFPKYRDANCDVIVGMVAKNHIRKDYLSLARIVAELNRHGLKVCAGMYMIDAVSPGHWKLDEIHRFVLEVHGIDINNAILKLPERWRYHGVSEEILIAIYTSYMDLHLYLTRGEAFGLPPLESTILGVPTISTAIPPQIEIFRDTDIFLVASNVCYMDTLTLFCPDLEDAFNKVLVVLENFDSYRKNVERASQILRERFSVEKMVDELEKAINVAIDVRKPLAEKLPLLSR